MKPHVLPVDQWQTSEGGSPGKGKGREKDAADADVNMDAASPSDPSGNNAEVAKKRKKESNYRHLIKSIVGTYLLISFANLFICLYYVLLTRISPKGNTP